MLCQKEKHGNSTVTICHSGTKNIEEHCLRADIVIAAIGVPEFLRANMVRAGAVVIDVGVNRISDPQSKRVPGWLGMWISLRFSQLPRK